MKQPVFEGVCTALVTPFRNGTVDTRKLQQLLDHQMQNGVKAVVLFGTTGESPTLTLDEKVSMLNTARNHTAGSMKIIAGAGCNDTARTIEFGRVADSLGADALLVVTPYYNKTTQQGLIEHYTMIADAVSCPVILYNVPSRTGLDISVESCCVLSRHPKIGGIKEACGNLSKVQRILDQCGDDLPVWSGNDDQIVSMQAIGARGVISVLSNILPKETASLYELCKQNNYTSAGKMQCGLMQLIDALFREVNPIPVKAAMNLLGYDVGLTRRPLVDASAETKAILTELIQTHSISRFT